jgi:tRNA threonylcarbamoyl adenosine modification protein YeaZ
MAILALEFSSPLRSVSVLTGNSVSSGVISRACDRAQLELHPFALIDRALREANLHRQAIECIAVGLGPGSYAGIRIAIAIAQGWGLARGVRLAGFSSAACVAEQFEGEGKFTIVVDAQRNEFFGARYEKKQNTVSLIEPFRLLTGHDWDRHRQGELFLRPDVLENGPQGNAAPPDAATLARLAVETDALHELPLMPIYLRPAEFVKAPPPRIATE